MDNDTYSQEIEFLQRVNRILSGDAEISVTNQKITETAYYDHKNKKIGINFFQLESQADNELIKIALMKGLNYHELAHNRYTKIKMKELNQKNTWRFVKNCLEDGRIETLYIQKFNKLKEYFQTTLYHFLTKDLQIKSQTDPELYLAIKSRQYYCQANVINTWRKMFAKKYGETNTKKVDSLINEYLLTYKYDDQITIINQINEILEKTAYSNKSDGHFFSISDEKHNSPQANQNQQKKETEELRNQLKKKKKQDDGKDTLISEEKINELQKLAEEKKDLIVKREEINSKIWEKKKQQIKAETQESKDQIEKEKKELEKQEKIVEDKIEETEKKGSEINNSMAEKTSQEIKKTINQIETELQKDQENIYAGDQQGQETLSAQITGTENLTAKKLYNELRKIRNELRNGTIGGLKNGIIEATRAMNFEKTLNTKIFNKHITKDQTDLKMGVNILIDVSGSMYQANRLTYAVRSAYIINKALEKTKSKTQIITYSTSYSLIKVFESKPQWDNLICGGGTNPLTALRKTGQNTKIAVKRHKLKDWLTIILTDGQFTNPQACKEEIERLNKEGHETILITIKARNNWMDSDYKDKYRRHGCKNYIEINHPEDLPNSFIQITKKFQKKMMIKKEKQIQQNL